LRGGGQARRVSTERALPTPRRAGAILCAVASLLLTLCSVRLFMDDGSGWSAGFLLLAGVGLLAAAVKSFRPKGRG
jgi:hypothetical protein